MAIFPPQNRTIDPYSSYNSNVVNDLTKMVTGGRDCIFSSKNLDITINNTSELILKPGHCFKDNVIIEITEDFIINMSDPTFYLNTSTGVWNEEGIYYIILDYTYVKSRPAPQASIKIIKPTQHNLLSPAFLFLKSVNVIFNSPSFEITDVYDYDPNDKLNIHREYSSSYVGVYDFLPPFNTEIHEGMIIYNREDDKLYYGASFRWQMINSTTDIIDTTSCIAGQLGYIDNDGMVKPAIATANETLANCCILSSGIKEDRSGQVQLVGFVKDVIVESGSNITAGNNVYLSSSEAGSITNIRSTGFGEIEQYIGKALNSGSDKINIWFQPGSLAGSGGTSSSVDISTDEYLTYHTLLEHSTYQYCYYDLFNESGTTETVIVTGALYDYETTSYIGNNSQLMYLESRGLIQQPFDDLLKSFLFYINCDNINHIDVTYQLSQDGTTFDGVWKTVNKNAKTETSNEFKNIKFKLQWNNDAITDEKIYSFGMLYGIEELTTVSRSCLNEVYTLSADLPTNSVINIPNYGVFTYGGKDLKVFWNRTKAVINIDYIENPDRNSITILKPASTGDIFEFNELYGYVDANEDNRYLIVNHINEAGAHNSIPISQKGVANGVATLDSNSKIPSSQIPSIAITSTTVVYDIAARDALTVEEGDVCIVLNVLPDQPKSYIYDGDLWIELKTSTDLINHEALYNHDSFVSQSDIDTSITSHETTYNHDNFVEQIDIDTSITSHETTYNHDNFVVQSDINTSITSHETTYDHNSFVEQSDIDATIDTHETTYDHSNLNSVTSTSVNNWNSAYTHSNTSNLHLPSSANEKEFYYFNNSQPSSVKLSEQYHFNDTAVAGGNIHYLWNSEIPVNTMVEYNFRGCVYIPTTGNLVGEHLQIRRASDDAAQLSIELVAYGINSKSLNIYFDFDLIMVNDGTRYLSYLKHSNSSNITEITELSIGNNIDNYISLFPNNIKIEYKSYGYSHVWISKKIVI